MTKEELAAVLAEHKLWREGSGGERANLSHARFIDADLRGADLSGANINKANFTGAGLRGAVLLRGGIVVITINSLCHSTVRSDGYTFFLWDTNKGFRIQAGCRFFNWPQAEMHWGATYGTLERKKLHEETQDILATFSRYMAKATGASE